MPFLWSHTPSSKTVSDATQEESAMVYIEANETDLRAVYKMIHRRAAADSTSSERFLYFSKRFADGDWERFKTRLAAFTRSLSGAVFVDYGSKFGHLAPLLASQGAAKIYCLDVYAPFLDEGAKFISPLCPVEFRQTQSALVDLPSQSVDFILVNEVISHINPEFLENFYAETARILKPGGEVLISDGNNLAHLPTRLKLIKHYELCENGPMPNEPDAPCFRDVRAELIREGFPAMDADRVAYLARNTSGLWGDRLTDAVERFLSGGIFVERPYRPGTCPTRPRTGVVEERGFFPEEIERSFARQGVEAIQVRKGKPVTTPEGRAKSTNFTILGTKLAETISAVQGQAQAEDARWYNGGAMAADGPDHPTPPRSAIRTFLRSVRSKASGS